MNYIVYKTTNKINGKIYIGVHQTKDPNVFDSYLGMGVSKKDRKKNRRGFPQAVAKYGYENFERETLAIFPFTKEGKEAAFAMEAELVNEDFVKDPNTYNLALGGRFTAYENQKKKIAQYSIEGKFIRVWDSIVEAETELNLNSISNCILGVTRYAGDYQWRYYTGNEDDIEATETKEKTVYQFDLQGNLLKTWKSASEACKIFPNPYSARAAINNCVNKKTHQSFGYYWSYKNKFEYHPVGTAVAKYSDDGTFIESYSTIKEAAAANNINTPTNICHAISGKQKRCGGFRWRYFYGNKDNIKPL